MTSRLILQVLNKPSEYIRVPRSSGNLNQEQSLDKSGKSKLEQIDAKILEFNVDWICCIFYYSFHIFSHVQESLERLGQ